METNAAAVPEETLRTWVQEHRVSWEISAWQELVEHSPLSVGFELRLFARHPDGRLADPGCDECVALYEKLRAIALFALPKEQRPTRYDIAPYDASLHLRPESHWQGEVQLAMHIVHRLEYASAVNDCEKRCASEIQESLRGLGVQPKSWHDARGA